MATEFTKTCTVLKTSDELGLVYGYAIVCLENGQPYFDESPTHDHIPEAVMVKYAAEFMLNSRVNTNMHEREGSDPVPDGTVVFAFPLTLEIAKALGFETIKKTGLIVGIRPSAAVYAKFKSGEYTGFSIGGYRGEDEAA